jgi:hypothetical protein
MYANVLLFPIPSNPDESAVYPSFYVNFAHACSNPGRLCQRYAPVLYLLCIFHTWRGSNAEGSCLLRAVWLQCDQGFLQQPTSSGAIKATLLQGVQAQALHGISHADSPCLLHTLCCCKLVLAVAWVQGSRSQAAHTEW